MKLPALFKRKEKAIGYAPPTGMGGWFPIVKEPFAGAWQRNIEWKRETVLAYHAVFACTTLIASDIAKLRPRMVREDSSGIWNEVQLGEAYGTIDRPNGYQNRIQFYENWINSKLTRGNAYILKIRRAGVVTELHVLHPDLVLPLVTESGDVYYQLGSDNLTGVRESGITVSADDIIHDRFNCLYHPLVGLPPIYACGLAAFQGLQIQESSALFFGNMSRPSGILTAPGAISDETAARLKEQWEVNYSGKNQGKTAVLGDDLKYQPLAMTAEQSQMIEHLRITAEIVCSTFHVPKYKVIGDAPSYNNIEALEQQYYSQCLQRLIEDIELCLDRGFDIPRGQGIEFDLDGLLRMDTQTQINTLKEAVSGALYSPNEARLKLNLPPVEGGDQPLIQQQNYSLGALARRDAQPDPFNTGGAAADEPSEEPSDMQRFFVALSKGFDDARA